MRRFPVALTLGGALTLLLLTPAAAAHAAGPARSTRPAAAVPGPILPAAEVDIGPVGYAAMYVDTPDHRVFLADPAGNVVTVVGFDGQVLGTVPDVYGADTIVSAGPLLYVSEGTSGGVLALNPQTLRTAQVATGIDQPTSMAYAGGYLWVSDANYALNRVSLAGAVRTFPEPVYFPDDLAASPAVPGTLFAGVYGESPATIDRIDVATGTPTVTASVFSANANLEQLVVSPSGGQVIPASGSPYDFEELSATTLQPDGLIYPGTAYPSAVAVSGGNGSVVATGLDDVFSDTDIDVDPIGAPAPIAQFATTADGVETGGVDIAGLGLDDTGRDLFAVTVSPTGDEVVDLFQVPAAPPKPPVLPSWLVLLVSHEGNRLRNTAVGRATAAARR